MCHLLNGHFLFNDNNDDNDNNNDENPNYRYLLKDLSDLRLSLPEPYQDDASPRCAAVGGEWPSSVPT